MTTLEKMKRKLGMTKIDWFSDIPTRETPELMTLKFKVKQFLNTHSGDSKEQHFDANYDFYLQRYEKIEDELAMRQESFEQGLCWKCQHALVVHEDKVSIDPPKSELIYRCTHCQEERP